MIKRLASMLKPWPRVLIPGALVVVVGASTLIAYGAKVGPWRPSLPDLGPIIAYVNNVPIHEKIAQSRVDSLAGMHGDIEKTLGKDWRVSVLLTLAEDVFVEQEASRRGIRVTGADLEQELSKVRGNFGTEQEFTAWLKSQKMDLGELRRRIKTQLLSSKVFRAVTSDVKATEAEIQKYYDGHKKDFQGSDGTTYPLADVRAQVEAKVLKAKRDETYNRWIDAEQKKATIKIVSPEWGGAK